MPEWLPRVLRRWDREIQPLFSGEDLATDLVERQTILETDLFVETQSARECWCAECNDELADLVFINQKAFFTCPACGILPAETERLRRWTFHASAFVAHVAQLIDATATAQTLIPDRLWHLGRYRRDTRSRNVLMACGATRADWSQLVNSITLPARPIWLLGPLAAAQQQLPDALSLAAVARWTGELELDHAAFDDFFAEPETPKKRPAAKRAGRSAAIEKLRKQLIEHLRAAREYARATQDQGEPRLLPRPTQTHLASASGLTNAAISRCLSDPTARELKLLWQTADNLDAVLRLKKGDLR